MADCQYGVGVGFEQKALSLRLKTCGTCLEAVKGALCVVCRQATARDEGVGGEVGGHQPVAVLYASVEQRGHMVGKVLA